MTQVMNLQEVAHFNAPNIFQPKCAVIITLWQDANDGRWYTFMGNKHDRIDRFDNELFKLTPRQAISKWRKLVADASEWLFVTQRFAYITIPASQDVIPIPSIGWFFEDQYDEEYDPELVEVDALISRYYKE